LNGLNVLNVLNDLLETSLRRRHALHSWIDLRG
jgi:hypothetical protein